MLRINKGLIETRMYENAFGCPLMLQVLFIKLTLVINEMSLDVLSIFFEVNFSFFFVVPDSIEFQI